MAILPIQNLVPESAPPAGAAIRGIVTLSWPYSSSTRQCAFLLADPDFRLRNRKGQVRVRFTGASAEAVAESHVGIGDEVVLQLQGASWTQDVGSTRTPGKSVAGELVYGRKLGLRVVRGEGGVDIDVDGPTPPRSPIRRADVAAATETPLPKEMDQLRASLNRAVESVPIYSSPAFAKRLRLSTDSLLDSAYDPFMDMDLDLEQPHKKQRTSFRGIGQWRYAERSPSPVKETFDLGVETELEQASPLQQAPAAAGAMETEDSQVAAVQAVQAEGFVSAQLPENVAAQRTTELGPQTGNVDSRAAAPTRASPSRWLATTRKSPTMLPPPLPRLQMPEEAAVADPSEKPEEGPSTPKLQAVPNSALPLPSPFAVEGVQPLYGSSGGVQPLFGSMGYASAAHPTKANAFTPYSYNIVREPTRPVQAVEPVHSSDIATEPAIERRVREPSPDKQAEKSPGMGRRTTPEVISDGNDAIQSQQTRQIDDATRDENNLVLESVQEPYTEVPNEPRDDDEDESIPEAQYPAKVTEYVEVSDARDAEDDEEDLPRQEASFLSQPQTPVKFPPSDFGLDGTVAMAPHPQSTPQSERDRVMTKTYNSLFGFKASPETQQESVGPVAAASPTPKGAVPDPVTGWFTDAMSSLQQAPAAVQAAEARLIEPSPLTTRLPQHAELDAQSRSPSPQADNGQLEPVDDTIALMEPRIDFVDVDERARVEENEDEIALLRREASPGPVLHSLSETYAQQPRSSAVAVIELGSSSDAEDEDIRSQSELLKEGDAGDETFDEKPALNFDDAQSQPASLGRDEHFSNNAVDIRPSYDEQAHPGPQSASEDEVAMDGQPSDAGPMSGDTEADQDLSSPLATSQLDQLEEELERQDYPGTDEMQLDADHGHEMPAVQATSRTSAITPRAFPSSPTRQPQTASVRSADHMGEDAAFVRFPAERVVEDSQSKTRSGTLSTQPTPTAETFDVIDVPHREPRKRPATASTESSERVMIDATTEHPIRPARQANFLRESFERIESLPKQAEIDVIELGSSSPIEETVPEQEQPPVEWPALKKEPERNVIAPGTGPSTDPAPLVSGIVPRDTFLEDIVDSDMLASPSQSQWSAPASIQPTNTSQVKESPLATEDRISDAEEHSQGRMTQRHISVSNGVTYPTLPPSPIQSQPYQDSNLARTEQVHTETARSALPPTPQLTQIPSEMLAEAPLDSSQLSGVIEPQREEFEPRFTAPPSSGQVPTSSVRKKALRKSLKALSTVPDVLSSWFSPKRSSGVASETSTKRVKHAEEDKKQDRSDVQHQGITPVLANGHSVAATQHPKPVKTPTNGMLTATTYFTPLSRLEEKLNPVSQNGFGSNAVDVLAVVSDCTLPPQRAKVGPKDFFTVFHVKDASLADSIEMKAEVFRPWKATLPVADIGDVVLLRSFVVKSKKRQAYLLSTDASAWCVWRFSQNKPAEAESEKPTWARKQGDGTNGVTREEVHGPPVELGEEERQHAKNLREWWVSMHGEEQRGGNGRSERDASGLISPKLASKL